MSLNAETNLKRRERLLAAAVEADFGLDGSKTLDQIVWEARFRRPHGRTVNPGENEKFSPATVSLSDVLVSALMRAEGEEPSNVDEGPQDLQPLIKRFARASRAPLAYGSTRYVSAEGVERLVRDAAAAFAEATGTELPWNISCRSAGDFGGTGLNYGPGELGRFGRRMAIDEAGEVIGQWARFAGWLRAAAKLPALRRVVKKTQSESGLGSPYTTVNLWAFARKFPSPHALERKLKSVRTRAEAVMASYAGEEKPAWRAIAQALMLEGRTGKAAIIAVALTISGQGGPNNWTDIHTYRQARDWLVEYHLCKVVDESDGVVARREAEPRLRKFGVEVFRIALPKHSSAGHQVGIEFSWLVRSTSGRTYHAVQWHTPLEAMREAIRAWKRQDELEREEADFIDFLRGEAGYCPLVVREDSKEAGNCWLGTQRWLHDRGWMNRKFIPAMWLIPHLDNRLVRNVAMVLYRRHAEQKK